MLGQPPVRRLHDPVVDPAKRIVLALAINRPDEHHERKLAIMAGLAQYPS
jgi:hypothetical protein